MARRPDPYLIDDENPELTDDELASARPAKEVLPPDLYAALVSGKMTINPDSGDTKVPVELDRQVVDAFKAEGPGWQARINDTLKKAVGL